MSENLNKHKFSSLIFNLDSFDGPMDILVELVRDKKLDILTLDISELTHQYLIFVNENLQYIAIDEASSYLIMASYLTELKTKILLPSINALYKKEETDFEIDKLRKQIFLYKQYKDMVGFFKWKQDQRTQIFSKKNDDLEEYIPDETPEAPLPDSVSIDRLIRAWRNVLIRQKDKEILNTPPMIIKVSDIDVDKIQEELKDFVEQNNIDDLPFNDFIKAFTKDINNLELICAIFVSLLVLVKNGYIKLIQQKQNGVIYISKNTDIILNDNHDDIDKALLVNQEVAKQMHHKMNFEKTNIYENNKKDGK